MEIGITVFQVRVSKVCMGKALKLESDCVLAMQTGPAKEWRSLSETTANKISWWDDVDYRT